MTVLLGFCMVLILLPMTVSMAGLNPWQSIADTTMTGRALYISELLEATDGTLYAGTWGGVWAYDGTNWTDVSAPTMTDVNTLEEAADGTLYAGTMTDGVWAYDGTGWTDITGTAMTGDALNVRSLLEATDGTLYAGTYYAGVWAYDGTDWADITDIAMTADARYVPTLLEATSGTLYAGTWGGGVWAYDGTGWTDITGINMTGLACSVGNLMEATDGTIYASTLDGLWAYDGTAWSKVPGMNRNVNTLLEAADGTFYAATNQGLWKYDGTNWTNVTSTAMTGNDLYVFDLLEATDGTLYAGTLNGVWAASPLSIGIPPTITTTNLPNGEVGVAYNQALSASGDATITWSAGTGLPSGLTLSSTGMVSGTPTTDGTFTFPATATNSVGLDTKHITLVINTAASAGIPPTITTTNLPNGEVGVAYNQALSASGDATITWSAGTGLPSGLTLSSTGVVSGTPTADGTFTFPATATNSVGSDTKHITLVIAAPPVITYAVSYNANGGTGTVPAPATVNSGYPYSILANPFNRNGYDFTGWNTAANGSGTSYAALATIPSVTADIILHAQWTPTGGSGGGGGTSASNSISPATANFDKTVGTKNHQDIVVRLTTVNGSLTQIKNGNTVLEIGSDYIVNGNTYTIKAAYLATLPTGLTTLVFDMSAGIDPALKVTVSESEVGTTTPEMWPNPFTDVNADDWFFDDVKYGHKNGLFIGTSATTFCPNMPMKRGMIVVVLGRLEGININDYSGASFDDVAINMYYAPYIKWGAKKGIVVGIGHNLFAPDANVTREQIVTILYRHANVSGLITEPLDFTDADDISYWAFDAMFWATTEKIMVGYPDGSLLPQGDVTRAEFAAMLHRFADVVKNK